MNGTYLSLFAGIGGLDLAAEAHGFTCVGQVEWDAACTRVLERWWPAVRRWGDVSAFDDAAYTGHAGGRVRGEPEGSGELRDEPRRVDRPRDPPPDLIVGGFPCQPVSTAGRRKGTEDDRWLWPEFARVIGELGPRLVLVENVPGLTTVNGGRAFSEVLGTLADLGYDTTWTSLRAADVGACHRRQRLFLLAHSQVRGLRRGEPSRSVERPEPDGAASQDAESDPRWLLDGESERPAANAQNAERRAGDRGTTRRMAWQPGGSDGDIAADSGQRSLAGTGSTSDGLPESAQRDPFAWGPYAAAIGRWERVLMREAPHPVDGKGRLDPAFVEWMMGFPQGWTEGLSRTQALKALGNAVVPQQGAAAIGLLEEVTSQA